MAEARLICMWFISMSRQLSPKGAVRTRHHTFDYHPFHRPIGPGATYMRKPPPPHQRGEPRTDGSGRKKGTPNRRTVQMKELMTSLCHDVDYQYRLRADFRRRRVHPAIESLVWAHTVGKPTERVRVSADVTMSQK